MDTPDPHGPGLRVQASEGIAPCSGFLNATRQHRPDEAAQAVERILTEREDFKPGLANGDAESVGIIERGRECSSLRVGWLDLDAPELRAVLPAMAHRGHVSVSG